MLFAIRRKLTIFAKTIKRRLVAPTGENHPQEAGQLRLHLGCGRIHLDGWVNVDSDPRSLADLILDIRGIGGHFGQGSVHAIFMAHSISYLRLWEARAFFAEAYALLQPGGTLTLEFPDTEKCAKALLESHGDPDAYLEAVRAFYAFDLDQVAARSLYSPYAFGWCAWHMVEELKKVGFREVSTAAPLTHGQLGWRDSRVEARK